MSRRAPPSVPTAACRAHLPPSSLPLRHHPAQATLSDVRSLILDALDEGQREAGLLDAANEACKLDVCTLLRRRHATLARGVKVVIAAPPTQRQRRAGSDAPRVEPSIARAPTPALHDAAARMAKVSGLQIEDAQLRAHHWEEVVRIAAHAANAAAAAVVAPKQQTLSGLRAWVREASAAGSCSGGGTTAGGSAAAFDPSPIIPAVRSTVALQVRSAGTTSASGGSFGRQQLPGSLPPPEFKGDLRL